MRSLLACVLLALSSPAMAAEAVHLAPHRAVYDLSLSGSSGTRAVEGARGRIVFDFTGDSCKGFALQYRQVTVLESSESGTRTSDLRNTTFESGDGRSFRFRTQSDLNGKTAAPVDGNAERGGKGLDITLKQPKRGELAVPGEVLFPAAHMRRLIEAARAGQSTVAVKVFDGSDDGRKVYDTLAVIGPQRVAAKPGSTAETGATQKPAAPVEAALRDGAMAAMPHWPVTLSYFSPGEGERTPVYVLAFDLYENGVSGALRLDYGEFSLKGELSRIDLLPESKDCK
ncbi:cell envelope integrity EipB family protein [Methylobacterium sp. SyP6R]|uniref:cell envelope integrity EipB family protein n=1 Tax=Methylobacterium sp. SyP6R TaxID=2718876 RepID=UPI001F1AC94E|nr:cell envelope integrity EipB family protein [Methylobacterium sp. SyP6R]MCF4127832.1 cell envelope integrity EipB family protein [Methylobacterium sp. SyP6R]